MHACMYVCMYVCDVCMCYLLFVVQPVLNTRFFLSYLLYFYCAVFEFENECHPLITRCACNTKTFCGQQQVGTLVEFDLVSDPTRKGGKLAVCINVLDPKSIAPDVTLFSNVWGVVSAARNDGSGTITFDPPLEVSTKQKEAGSVEDDLDGTSNAQGHGKLCYLLTTSDLCLSYCRIYLFIISILKVLRCFDDTWML
jgi:hypothetical protein